MAFGVSDFRDLLALLQQHPEWRAELRQLLLTEEILTLPQVTREIAEAQRRTDEQIARISEYVAQLAQQMVQLTARVDQIAEQLAQLTARVDDLTQRLQQLTARVDDLTQRLEQLTARVDQIAEQLAQLTARVDDLTQRLEQLTARVDQIAERLEQLSRRVDELTSALTSLTHSVQRIGDDVAKLKEFYLEQRYYTRSPAYFGRLVRRARSISYEELCRVLDDAVDQGILTEDERDELIQTDVVVQGRRRSDGEEVHLVVEVSWGIGPGDVTRATQRARTFEKLGWTALPVVAGGWANADAREAAQQEGVVVILDGAQAER